MPDLSVAILSYNTRDCLKQCLDTLHTAAGAATLEVVVVDNGSTDGSREMLAAYRPAITLIEPPDNLGFAGGNNLAVAHATASVVLLLNSDAFVTPDVLRQAPTLLRDNPRIGVVGTRLLNPDGTVQATAGRFPTFWDDVRASLGFDRRLASNDPVQPAPVDWVQGACMFVRTTAVQQVGGLDERFFMYSEEVDWCHRFRLAGWEVWYLPAADVVHIGGASSQNDLRRRLALYRGRLGYRRKAGGPVASVALWGVMLAGLAVRALVRPAAQLVIGRRVGRQTARSDLALLKSLLGVDPLSRWAVS